MSLNSMSVFNMHIALLVNPEARLQRRPGAAQTVQNTSDLPFLSLLHECINILAFLLHYGNTELLMPFKIGPK